MNIISIYDSPFSSFITHDRSAAIISEDKIYAYEEAKLSSVKEDGYAISAEKSLFAGFKELNLNPYEIDYFVFPKTKNFGLQLNTIKSYLVNVLGTNKFSNYCNIKNYQKKFVFLKHHDSHLSLAGFTSPFQKCVTLSMDGGGDYGDHNHMVARIFDRYKRDPFSKRVIQLKGPNGLANFHGWLTESIGYLEDGKTSGLASYGSLNKNLYEKFSHLFIKQKNGFRKFIKKRKSLEIYNLDKVKIDSHEIKKVIYHQPGITNLTKITQNYLPEDIARTGTQIIQDNIIETLKIIKKKAPDIDNIALVGGLFNNVRINQSIIESRIFKNYHFTMNPGDGGLSLGGALLVKHLKSKKIVKKNFKRTKLKSYSPYIGPSFENNEIEEILKSANLKYKKLKTSNLINNIAKLLNSGKIIGTFWGRAEYGPRSLGHRSILADPRLKNIKEIINHKLKRRDWFMPFAPAVLEEKIKEFSDLQYKCPYMQVSFPCKNEIKKKLSSAIHVDGTARIQSVSKSYSKFFYNIINRFYKLSKVPAVLNTSFNRHGIATIGTPRQAIEHFLMGTCDILIVGNYLVEAVKNRKMTNYEKITPENHKKLLRLTHLSYHKKNKIKNKYVRKNKNNIR